MDTSLPHLTLEIRSPLAEKVEKVPGKEISALFSRAEELVGEACQEPLLWVFSDGTQKELLPDKLIRLDYEPTPSSVRVHLSVPRRVLDEHIQAEARKVVENVKRRWGTRLKIFFARLLGMDMERLDQENVDSVAADMSTLVSGWILHTVGYRLSVLLENRPNDPVATS